MTGALSDFTEAVLGLVDRIPPGRVMTYGAIKEELGRGSAIGVGGVMAKGGHDSPWWRVVRANGTLPLHLMVDALEHWDLEGTPMRRGAVDVRTAIWFP